MTHDEKAAAWVRDAADDRTLAVTEAANGERDLAWSHAVWSLHGFTMAAFWTLRWLLTEGE